MRLWDYRRVRGTDVSSFERLVAEVRYRNFVRADACRRGTPEKPQIDAQPGATRIGDGAGEGP